MNRPIVIDAADRPRIIKELGGDPRDNVAKFNELMAAIKARDEEIKTMCGQALKEIGEGKADVARFTARLVDLEQKFAARTGLPSSLAAKAVYAETVDRLVRGFSLENFKSHGRLRVEVDGSLMGKATPVTTGEVGTHTSVGGIPTWSPRFELRDVIVPRPVTSTVVNYVRAAGFTNNAAVVAEGTAKPTSDVEFVGVAAQPQVVAHLFKVSEQALSDAGDLQIAIDTFATSGLRVAEEKFLLNGDATSQNAGFYADATAAAAIAAGTTNIDAVLAVAGELEDSGYLPSSVLMHTSAWRAIRGSKNADGNYLLVGAPAGQTTQVLWAMRVAALSQIPATDFVVLDNRYVAILDRQRAAIEFSNSDGDNFSKNLITARAEERVGTLMSDFAATRKASFAAPAAPLAASKSGKVAA